MNDFIFPDESRLPAEVLPLSTSTNNCFFQDESRLPAEVLVDIVSRLDAPSAVCFALTCHENYNAVLLTCQPPRLKEVCPRDVRDPLPEAIEEQAYNTLTLGGR